MYERIGYAVEGPLATIELARPEKLNAYTPEMGEELVAAFGEAVRDPAVRAVVLAGQGRAFCAGVDLDYLRAHMAGQRPKDASDGGPRLGREAFVRDFPLVLARFPKPVVAAIHGDAFGVGVTMTLGCDVRVAAHDARLGLNFTKLGVLPGLGSTHLLPQLVGMPKALELVLSGATVEGAEACRIGLVQYALPADEVRKKALEIAGAMAEQDPAVLAAAKEALRFGGAASMADAMEKERSLSKELEARTRPTRPRRIP